jgi:predicted nucleic acid-binding protein
MDERIGRDMARHLGLIFTGTIGALMDAKDKGIIEHILPVVVELRTKAGFRISEVLFKHIEVISGEYLTA